MFYIMRVFHSVLLYVYKQSVPKMVYVFTWGCCSVLLSVDRCEFIESLFLNRVFERIMATPVLKV